jgi:lipid kinase YegS
LGLDITIIMHPRGEPARIEELRDAVERLRRQGHGVTPRLTFERGDATVFARAAARARHDLIVAAGGDGTVNEVVNGIARARWQPRLAILPIGTANDFAASFGLPTDFAEGLRIAVHGRPLAVDVARVNRRFFVNVSTGGFGTRSVVQASPEVKRRLGSLAYLVTGLWELIDLQRARARFDTAEGMLYDGDFLIFAVGNARRTGGGSELTPRAEVGDGKLDVLVVPAIPRMEFLALLPELRAGSHVDSPHVLYRQTATLTVTADDDLPVNVDGEPISGGYFRYALHPRPISVMVP